MNTIREIVNKWVDRYVLSLSRAGHREDLIEELEDHCEEKRTRPFNPTLPEAYECD